jgi:Fe-S oxidoreductase
MSSKHSLPLLSRRQDELSKCAFCPKLCRATCVVSDAEPREALTPWGKMTNAFDGARSGDVSAERASLAWACSNCFRCREACDHRNPVTESLNDARADYVGQGLAPAAVQGLLARRPDIEAGHRAAVLALADEPGVDQNADRALLLGCRYAKVFPAEARAAIRLASRLTSPVRLVTGCCGAWQRAAGDPAAADAARQRLFSELDGRQLLVLDPRCALELAACSPTTLVELAARKLSRFDRPLRGRSVRYHDSCALGRGLGLYEEPRRLLSRVTGTAPEELEMSRQLARCSGGGGILPVSMPEIAKAARQRLAADHAAHGGGTLVTGCASSLSQMRRSGVDAVDLISLLEAALPAGVSTLSTPRSDGRTGS